MHVVPGTLGFIGRGFYYVTYDLVQVDEIIRTMELGSFFWTTIVEQPFKTVVVNEVDFIVATPVDLARYRVHGSRALDFRNNPGW